MRASASLMTSGGSRRMTLSAVTLHDAGVALTGNYLKVETAAAREPNRIVDLRIGGVTQGGLREAGGGELRIV